MRIGINCVSAVMGGNVTYLTNLIAKLDPLLLARGDTAVVYTREKGMVPVPASRAMVERRVAPADLAAMRRTAWDQAVLPWHVRKDRLDVFYGPADSVPLALRCRTVCGYQNPNPYTPLNVQPKGHRSRLVALRALALASARKCRKAIFVSAAGRDAIAPVLRLAPDKAQVIHHGIGPAFSAALTGPNPWDRPYILTVSTQYDYKNTPRLIEAFDKYVRRRGLPHGLAVVGDMVEPAATAAIHDAIGRLSVGDSVRLTGGVSYPAAVGNWYRHAAVFAFPTWRETFGIPLLEAMAADLPIVAANTDVLREVAGDAALYCDPYSVESIGERLADALDDGKRAGLVERGRERLKEFTWEKCAEQTLAVFDEAVR